MFDTSLQPYQGPVIISKRSPATGARLSEIEVAPHTIKASLRRRTDQGESPANAKARLAQEFANWKAERKAAFEKELNHAG